MSKYTQHARSILLTYGWWGRIKVKLVNHQNCDSLFIPINSAEHRNLFAAEFHGLLLQNWAVDEGNSAISASLTGLNHLNASNKQKKQSMETTDGLKKPKSLRGKCIGVSGTVWNNQGQWLCSPTGCQTCAPHLWTATVSLVFRQ